jgi:hypothetical protein
MGMITIFLVIVILLTLMCLASAWARKRECEGHDYLVGLELTTVRAGSSIDIGVQAEVSFRPARLIVPSNVGGDFLIAEIMVGHKNQLIAKGSLPGLMFSEKVTDVHVLRDVARAGAYLTVRVVNQSTEARVFQGGFVGPVVCSWWQVLVPRWRSAPRREEHEVRVVEGGE